jgi:hypothetical protein
LPLVKEGKNRRIFVWKILLAYHRHDITRYEYRLFKLFFNET